MKDLERKTTEATRGHCEAAAGEALRGLGSAARLRHLQSKQSSLLRR